MTAELLTMPVISISHLDRETAAQLAKQGDETPWCSCAPWSYGLFLRLEELTCADTPGCLDDLCAWMQRRGFLWICLDRDADPVNELPIYLW